MRTTAPITPHYELRAGGEFAITGYNSARPFASFFPGIAGPDGIPLWLFYVNRGQGVCSMGIQDKQHPIMEFLPANWAYNLVTRQGFRTFVKPLSPAPVTFYEPFQDHFQDRGMEREQRMIIAPARLTLEEVNHTLGLTFTVDYAAIVQDRYAGLARTLRITNTGRQAATLEVLDGLPLIIPYGVDNDSLKMMRRVIEAFVEVTNTDARVPFFKGKVEPADRPDVLPITKGNFYLGFVPGEGTPELVSPIVDPEAIFGARSDFSYPERFLSRPLDDLHDRQAYENRLPCAMGGFPAALAPGESVAYASIIGHAPSREELNALVPAIANAEYLADNARANRDIVAAIQQNAFICSGEPTFDAYAQQNFLDNALRGGFPVTLHGERHRYTLHLYSRKHGDLERDYNDFRLTPTPYSQGNGNYRDINQNRRSDLLFNPDVGAANVVQFVNLIQLDGFNPLVIKELRFTIADGGDIDALLERYLGAEHVAAVRKFLARPFTPGELMTYLHSKGITLTRPSETVLGDLLGACETIHDTDHGEGFWTDHWHYNLDLLENYLAIYPEKCREILFDTPDFTFYDTPYRVQPRDDRYVIWEERPMQLDAVIFDAEKAALIADRPARPNQVRTGSGTGEVYRTTLMTKLLCLIVNKISSLDPAGVGVEMEAGKPNWYDALNGLPGLLGSSVSETLEIRRHIAFLLERFGELGVDGLQWPVFAELKTFMDTLGDLLGEPLSAYDYWDRASAAREAYREATRLGISGAETVVSASEVSAFFDACLARLDAGIARARDPETGIPNTYFINAVADYDMVEEATPDGGRRVKRNARGFPCYRPTAFRQTPLPPFLEGPVHYLRCRPGREDAAALAAGIRNSDLFDRALKMYKVNAPLSGEPMEIGRARVFSPGWLENESIWLHMEYKYLLELLRNELYDEFFQAFRDAGVPFFDPAVYGRSVLENSSFIVSSANPDPTLHGAGFVARLSGATAEFIHILQLMTVGSNPFRVERDGSLALRFTPALPEWLFTRTARSVPLLRNGQWTTVDYPANCFGFMFLGVIPVTYHNPERADTFGPSGAAPARWTVVDGGGVSRSHDGEALTGDIVAAIRDRTVQRIDIELR